MPIIQQNVLTCKCFLHAAGGLQAHVGEAARCEDWASDCSEDAEHGSQSLGVPHTSVHHVASSVAGALAIGVECVGHALRGSQHKLQVKEEGCGGKGTPGGEGKICSDRPGEALCVRNRLKLRREGARGGGTEVGYWDCWSVWMCKSWGLLCSSYLRKICQAK